MASLPPKKVDLLIEVLYKNVGHFAWSYQDMPGLDPKLVVHDLAMDPKTKPVKKKLCKMHPKVSLLVKPDLEKLLEGKIICSIDYSESRYVLVANIHNLANVRFFLAINLANNLRFHKT